LILGFTDTREIEIEVYKGEYAQYTHMKTIYQSEFRLLLGQPSLKHLNLLIFIIHITSVNVIVNY
jgi:hypothetical protein